MRSDDNVKALFKSADYHKTFGIVKLEEWPEGLVLWVGGQIRWASFRDPEFSSGASA